mgnify:FL=1
MMNKVYLGIDIGGTAAKFGLVDEDGNILQRDEFSVSFDGYETPILKTVLEKTDYFIDSSGLEFREISGIGVSATGQIDSEIGEVIGSAGHIKNWVGSKIKESFEKKYSVKTIVINDANSAALGEKWIGAGRGYKNIVAITIGTGVGGGIIVDDKILLGKRGLAGEIGHIVIHGDGESCSCGNVGCLERYASTKALVRSVSKLQKENPTAFPKDFEENINGRKIFDALNENSLLSQAVDKWVNDISLGIISLVHIFNPEQVIIGGGVSTRKEFIESLSKKVHEKVMPRFAEGLEIVPAKLGNDAGLIGAIYYLIENK